MEVRIEVSGAEFALVGNGKIAGEIVTDGVGKAS